MSSRLRAREQARGSPRSSNLGEIWRERNFSARDRLLTHASLRLIRKVFFFRFPKCSRLSQRILHRSVSNCEVDRLSGRYSALKLCVNVSQPVKRISRVSSGALHLSTKKKSLFRKQYTVFYHSAHSRTREGYFNVTLPLLSPRPPPPTHPGRWHDGLDQWGAGLLLAGSVTNVQAGRIVHCKNTSCILPINILSAAYFPANSRPCLKGSV